ncbi:FAD-dependent monooxygenase [Spiractinospora alimapuensis]|uniref:FAD-dependent monooxygenase n=1 Tax=Spiractinospora alimapuensis TaxID=2820884 RepID=UPI001F1AAB98|nr:FAD-dependent monooxygenase [Spiractinospora alimapuensis]QVQ53843.1 FAD-dependent monooxygenase [Spiractinospora alimapuensis]
MRELNATVVGGGLAGLASAITLTRAGWRTTVLESRQQTGEEGAGVGLPRNGITALRSIGFSDAEIDDFCYRTFHVGYRDLKGHSLLRGPTGDDIPPSLYVWGVHRQRIHAALLAKAVELGAEVIAGAPVTGVRPGAPDGDLATVTWEKEGTAHQVESHLVIAADGMWSVVRRELFPAAKPRYSGHTSWRAIIPRNGYEDALSAYLGPNADFGTMPISESEQYWYGYFRHPEKATFDDEVAAARARFFGWAPEVVEQIEDTKPEQLMRHDVYHLPGGLPNYVKGRVLMVGDAAHAALPTMGAGASTSLEDGASLGTLVAQRVVRGNSLGNALAKFDRVRRPRCRALARQARINQWLGADVGGGPRQSLRNTAMRLIPTGALIKGSAPLVRWTPPN